MMNGLFVFVPACVLFCVRACVLCNDCVYVCVCVSSVIYYVMLLFVCVVFVCVLICVFCLCVFR